VGPKERTVVEPTTDEEWQAAVDAAHLMLMLDSLRQFGLIEGGEAVNVERAYELLKRGRGRGVLPKMSSELLQRGRERGRLPSGRLARSKYYRSAALRKLILEAIPKVGTEFVVAHVLDVIQQEPGHEELSQRLVGVELHRMTKDGLLSVTRRGRAGNLYRTLTRP
jgi:hypothetical protein